MVYKTGIFTDSVHVERHLLYGSRRVSICICAVTVFSDICGIPVGILSGIWLDRAGRNDLLFVRSYQETVYRGYPR